MAFCLVKECVRLENIENALIKVNRNELEFHTNFTVKFEAKDRSKSNRDILSTLRDAVGKDFMTKTYLFFF